MKDISLTYWYSKFENKSILKESPSSELSFFALYPKLITSNFSKYAGVNGSTAQLTPDGEGDNS